ncbi:hypothetical protein [Labrys neptuniae]
MTRSFATGTSSLAPLGAGLLWAAMLALSPVPARAQSAEQLIAAATKSVASNRPNAQNDVTVLIATLRQSQSMPEQSELIEALRLLGDAKGSSPPAIKANLKEVMPLILLDFARGRADGRVRAQALLSLRSFDPSPEHLGEAIALARADTSADRDIVHRHGELLAKWQQDPSFDLEGETRSRLVDPAGRKQALAALGKREVSYSALHAAVGKMDTKTIKLLADAGLQFGGVHTPAAQQAIAGGLVSACRDDEASPPEPERIAQTFQIVQQYGFGMDGRDEYGNGLVMEAVQSCPAPVVAKLIELGASPNPVNHQNATPLSLAFVSGYWDVAKVLVDHGAGMSQAEADTTFMELPQDPAQKDLVQRALKNAGKP